MNKMFIKRIIAIISILFIIIGLLNFTKARSSFSVSDILNDIKNTDTFLSRSYSYYLGKIVNFNSYDDLDSRRLTCIAHWYGTAQDNDRVISNVIDVNLDKVNSVKLNGHNVMKEYQYLFQALAKATAENNSDSLWNKNENVTYQLIWDMINAGYFDLNGTSNNSTSLDSGDWAYYRECINYGKDIVNNSIEGKATCDKYDKDLIDTEVIAENCYLGPFQYSFTGEGNVSFTDIEITGDNKYSEKLTDLTNVLYIKSKGGFTNVKNGKIAPDTDFYIKANQKINDSAKIKVVISVGGKTAYKSRILLIKNKIGWGGQSLAAYSTGAGKQENTAQSLEYEFDNNRGNIVIHKAGIKNGVLINKVENMGFKLFYKDNNKDIYLTIKDGNVVGTTEKADEATVVYTDKNGDAYVYRVDSRYQYYLDEITVKTNYSSKIIKATQKLDEKEAKEKDVPIISEGRIGPIEVKRQQESSKTTIYIEDTIETGTLKLTKLDFDKSDIEIFGAKFKVYSKETKRWVKAEGKDGIYKLKTYEDSYNNNPEYYKENYTTEKNEATEFETNQKGEFTIEGIDIGKYSLEEIYLYNENGKINYGYTEVDNPSNIDEEYVYWSIDGGNTKNNLEKDGSISLEVVSSEKADESSIIVYNKKKYIKITGYVWEDIHDEKNNTYATHGENTYAEGDILVKDINVRLKDKDGNVIKTTKTDENGAYEFTEVSRKAIEAGLYYVEFEYNGLTYTSVVALVGTDSSVNSKAGEVVEQRQKLNAAFAEITNKGDIKDRNHGYSRDNKGNTTGELTYRNVTEKWYSTFESTTYNNGTYNNVNLTANTDVTGYSLEEEFKKGRYIVDETGSFVIPNVNLGMRERSKTQIGISNDIENVRVDLNGYSHIYYYKQKAEGVKDSSAFNVGVKFGKNDFGEYKRAIYPSDVEYSATDAEEANKLQVYVTYATTVKNLSSSNKVSVNEIVNYYDKEYTIVESWIDDNKDNKVNWTDTSKYGQKYSDDNFNGVYTTSLAGRKLNAGESAVIHIQFKVSDKAVLGLLNNTSTLNNVSEIYSYTSFYGTDAEGCKTGDVYSGIDEFSAPGNANMELDNDRHPIKTTYEADTDSAPSLLLEAKNARTIEGNVFEDKTAQELLSGQERKGDGIFNEGENIISGVKVELINSKGNVATIYPYEVDENGNPVANTKIEGKPAVMTTGSDGYYIFRGIEPDVYLIRYTYENGVTKIYDTNGNEVKDINVQEYKSTVITSNTIKSAFEDNDAHLNWYKETDTRYSDARDNYKTREDIDKELKNLEATSTTTETSMNADSPKFDLGIEYETIYSASTGDYYEYKVKNIDFGIAERPRQSITLDKHVSHIKVTLSNGNVLVNGDPRKEKLNYVTVTNDTIYITMDNEIMYGAQVQIEYELGITNTSEIDYTGNGSETYYYYGEKGGNIVTINKETVTDYVDSEVVVQNVVLNDWSMLDGAGNNKYWNIDNQQSVYEELLKKFSGVAKTENNTILTPIENGTAVEGKSRITKKFAVEKVISSSSEALEYDNEAEVVSIEKTGGSKLYTKLGNYAIRLIDNVGALPEESAEAKAERVAIIPPTGATNHNVTYAIISVISLAVLAAGVFGTKKFLKK